MVKKTFSSVISAKDLDGLKEVVARATKIYNGEAGEEPIVETVYGAVPLTSILDIDTRWELCSCAYMEILTEAKYISDTADQKVEVAKLIATNATLRAMTGDTSNGIDDLI